jgi:hypothetical protein
VRCPACGFTGNEGIFHSGCPVCGYSAPGGKIIPFPEKEKLRPAAALPLWVYVTAVAALVVVAGMLIFHLVQ